VCVAKTAHALDKMHIIAHPTLTRCGGCRSDLHLRAQNGRRIFTRRWEDSLKRKSSVELAPKVDGVDEAAKIFPSLKATLPADLILNILRNGPSGLTAKEVADQLGGAPSNIGSRLSKFAAYGIIKQNRRRTAPTASSGAIYTLPIL
jgi:hypothetical protein